MRVATQRACLHILAAILTVMSVSGVAVAESSDAIGRWLAEQSAEETHRAPSAGKIHDVVPAKPPAAEEERRMLEEIEMLERARAEADSRRETLGGETRPHEAAVTEASPVTQERLEDQPTKSEADPPIEQQTGGSDGERRAQDAELAQMEAEREAEAERIDTALRNARNARNARDRPPTPSSEAWPQGVPLQKTTDEVQGGSSRTDATAGHDPTLSYMPERSGYAVERDTSPRYRKETRVTVLMTMEAGNRGIRRHHKTADPLLCGERGCYVGTGAASPAEFLPRRRAFGPGQTLGERAGACRESLGCVFRSVDLVAYPAVLQPIDMRLLRHDRRQPLVLTETSECRITQGRLACAPFHGPGYTMWVVPEQIAELAGATELARAVESGLVDSETTAGRTPRH